MLIERIEVDFEYEDDRGVLTQLVHRGYSQINVVTSKGGMSRGGHYHKYNTEAYFIIRGKCKVTARRGDEQESGIFVAGDFLVATMEGDVGQKEAMMRMVVTTKRRTRGRIWGNMRAISMCRGTI